MKYDFVCPKCENKELIEMKISEYSALGHKCSKCNTELVREVSSLICGASISKCDGFYRKVN